MPSVSVIVPTRNSARTLEGCLRSIREQDQPVELIVVDNDSQDETPVIAAGFADRVENSGPERSDQRNRGADLSTGDYLLFIDSDMYLEPGVVSDCLNTIDRTGAAGAIIPEISIGVGFWARCRALERSCYHNDDSVEAARFFPREAFQSAGGYNVHVLGMEDWELSDRIAAGRSYPRTSAKIVHDEGRMRLRSHMTKKRYYGRGSAAYVRGQASSARRGNMLIRMAYLRHWRTLLRHPVLATGMVVFKMAEAGAFASGMLARRQQV